MENSSLSGIELVKSLYNSLLNSQFPEQPENDALYDLYADFIELDGYYAGIISSFIKGKVLEISKYRIDTVFDERLKKVSETIGTGRESVKPFQERKALIDCILLEIQKIVA